MFIQITWMFPDTITMLSPTVLQVLRKRRRGSFNGHCRSLLDIFEGEISAPAPVEDTADRDGWVAGVTASTPRKSCLLIQVFSYFPSPSDLLKLQPGRDAHEARFLTGLMEHYPTMPPAAKQKLLHRLNMIYIAVTKNWTEAIAASGDGGSPSVYPPNYQPPVAPTIVYRDIPQPRAPRGRGQ
uniref:Uncharacterized protein n=1 Tax=Timema genevievae TaxID=629358 RepID=A0A7R9PSY9_TIMGE|nr:unnamed protein product [Timema genevievae]